VWGYWAPNPYSLDTADLACGSTSLCGAVEPRVLQYGQSPSENPVKAVFLEHVGY